MVYAVVGDGSTANYRHGLGYAQSSVPTLRYSVGVGIQLWHLTRELQAPACVKRERRRDEEEMEAQLKT